LEQVHNHVDLPFATYCDVRLKQFHNAEANIVCVGDAAHAMSPVLGQGINFALLDAQTLSQCLHDAAADKSPLLHSTFREQLAAALLRFSSLRRPALRYYQSISFFLNPWFQSSTVPGMALARDLLFNPMTRLPMLRQQMLLSQVGAKSGFFPLHRLDRSIEWEYWNTDILSPQDPVAVLTK